MNDRFTVGLIVANHHSVLNRISGLYGKRGYNIDSLAVGETEDPRYSRMTIVSTGDLYTRTQVVRQLSKLYDVKQVVLLEDTDSVSVEHLLIKIKTGSDGNWPVTSLLNDYGGKVMEIGDHFIIADLTGSPAKIQEFIEKCVPLGIIELCRSGALSLAAGLKNTLSILNQKGG